MAPTWSLPFIGVVAGSSVEPKCCPGNGCPSPKNGTKKVALQHWCKADSMELPPTQQIKVEWDTPPSNYDCLADCEVNPLCYYATFDTTSCNWYGRSSGHGSSGVQKQSLQNVWFLMQTDEPHEVPQDLQTEFKRVPLGHADSYAQCKQAWIQAFVDKTVDQNIGEFTDSKYFTFADTNTGKGNVRVTARYNDPAPAPSAALSTIECNGRLLTWQAGDDSVILDKVKDGAKPPENAVWLLSGGGLFPAGDPGKCLTTKNQDPDGKRNPTTAHAISMATDQSTCVSVGNHPGKYPGKEWIVHITAWGDRAHYGMGSCDKNFFLSMEHLKKGQEACGPDQHCGSFTFDLAGDADAVFLDQVHAGADDNCYGFISTTTTTTTTTSTIKGGWCVSAASGATMNQCMPCNSREDFCGHNCPPELWDKKHGICKDLIVWCTKDKDTKCPQSELEDEMVNSTVDATQVLEEVAVGADESVVMCPAKFPGVSVPCVGGLQCCGEDTLTPECYFEEFNSCCQPEGSEISILCAKGESCSSINGVPICKPPGDACNCGKRLGLDPKSNQSHYFCLPPHSLMCHHAPDDASCHEVYGDDADFCYIPPAFPLTLV